MTVFIKPPVTFKVISVEVVHLFGKWILHRFPTEIRLVFQDKITSYSRLFKTFCSSLCQQKHYKIGF